MHPDQGDTGDDDRDVGDVKLDRISANGYLAIKHEGKQVYVHRLCAVAKYGIGAMHGDDVHVHHKGCTWLNNEVEVVGSSEHSEIHAEEHHDIENTSYRRKSVLEYYYEDRGMTTDEIASRFDVTASTIRHQMAKHGIDRRGGAIARNETVESPTVENRDPQTTLLDYNEAEV